MDSPWMTVGQTASYTGRHYKTVLAALQDEVLEGHQRARRGHWRVHRDAADSWVRGKKSRRRVRVATR